MRTSLKIIIISKIKSIESKKLGAIVKWLILKTHNEWRSGTRKFPYTVRALIAEIVPNRPLEYNMMNAEVISVMIPCIDKDWAILPFCLQGIETNILNKVQKISVVTNDIEYIPNYRSSKLEILHEKEFLANDIIKLLDRYVPQSKRGWVIKQILTFKFAYQSADAYILVVDADTVLTKPRLFVQGGRQVLIPVVEYNDYDSFATNTTWGRKGASFGISFTCHHLLLQTDLVREMFDEIGGFSEGVKRWLISADNDPWSPISDMHSYGTWMLNTHPGRTVFARWGNLRVSRTVLEHYQGQSNVDVYRYLVSKFSRYNSISFHHYLKDDYVGTE